MTALPPPHTTMTESDGCDNCCLPSPALISQQQIDIITDNIRRSQRVSHRICKSGCSAAKRASTGASISPQPSRAPSAGNSRSAHYHCGSVKSFPQHEVRFSGALIQLLPLCRQAHTPGCPFNQAAAGLGFQLSDGPLTLDDGIPSGWPHR